MVAERSQPFEVRLHPSLTSGSDEKFIVVTGGRDPSSMMDLDTCEIYDIENDSWQRGP